MGLQHQKLGPHDVVGKGGNSIHAVLSGQQTAATSAHEAGDVVSATSQSVSTAAACRKSSISMASRGLWLPLALRTNSMQDGTPATVNVAGSCEAGFASVIAGMPSLLAESVSLAKTSGCDGATSADARAPRSNRTPRFCPTSL